MKKFETIETKLWHSNPYWDYRVDKYRMPSGKLTDYYFVDSRGSVFVIAETSERKYLMVSQYRYLNSKVSIEFPGGGVNPNSDHFRSANSELEEETGYIANNIELIGVFNPCNGMTNEICHLYFATDLSKSEANPDESEEITILEMSATEINSKIGNNTIWDGMTLAAWSMFINSKLYKGEKYENV